MRLEMQRKAEGDISRVSECMRVEVLIRWSNLFGMLRLVVVHLSAQKVN